MIQSYSIKFYPTSPKNAYPNSESSVTAQHSALAYTRKFEIQNNAVPKRSLCVTALFSSRRGAVFSVSVICVCVCVFCVALALCFFRVDGRSFVVCKKKPDGRDYLVPTIYRTIPTRLQSSIIQVNISAVWCGTTLWASLVCWPPLLRRHPERIVEGRSKATRVPRSL